MQIAGRAELLLIFQDLGSFACTRSASEHKGVMPGIGALLYFSGARRYPNEENSHVTYQKFVKKLWSFKDNVGKIDIRIKVPARQR